MPSLLSPWAGWSSHLLPLAYELDEALALALQRIMHLL